MSRAPKIAFAFSLLAIACHSASNDANGTSAAPTVSSWPVLPADPVDAMTAAENDPTIIAYARKADEGLRPQFRDCIDRAPPKNSKLACSVVMIANVNSDGTVASAKPTELQGFSAESMKCLTKAITSAHFPPPPADPTIIKLPFILTASQ